MADSDSVASSPRSDHYSPHDPRVRVMCSFGGKILPRPQDNQLRYVGGDTRIVAIHRSTNYSTLLAKLSKLSGISDVTVKYQLPNEDLDALISVTTDEDVENMMEEYDRVSHNQVNPGSARLRLFLFAEGEDSRAGSISSLLGSTNRENWFFDALNSGSLLERGRSEASSIVSEVPDYLFGLDNSDDTQGKEVPSKVYKNRHVVQDNVSTSDPGSPAPVVSSSYCSTSSAVPIVPSLPDLPPVKTKPDNPEPVMHNPVERTTGSHTIDPPMMAPPAGYPGKPMVHYVQDPNFSGPPMQHVPFYYVPGPIPPGNVNVPIQSVPMRAAPYQVNQYPIPMGQVPVGYHPQIPSMDQLYIGAAMHQVPAGMEQFDHAGKVVPDGMNQQPVYYGIRNASTGQIQVQKYPGPGMMVPGQDDSQRNGPDSRSGRSSQ